MFPANARALLLPPSGCGVLLGDGTFRLPVIGKARHRAALDKVSAGSRLRCAALLTRNGRDYDRDGIMVTIREEEVGFLPWMDSHDLRVRLRDAGYLEAVCKAEITGNHVLSEGWDYVGVTIDACHPFTVISAQEWHDQHALGDQEGSRVLIGDGPSRTSNRLSNVFRSLQQLFIERLSLSSQRKMDWSQSPGLRTFWRGRFRSVQSPAKRLNPRKRGGRQSASASSRDG